VSDKLQPMSGFQRMESLSFCSVLSHSVKFWVIPSDLILRDQLMNAGMIIDSWQMDYQEPVIID
jgi:hypothetical protein